MSAAPGAPALPPAAARDIAIELFRAHRRPGESVGAGSMAFALDMADALARHGFAVPLDSVPDGSDLFSEAAFARWLRANAAPKGAAPEAPKRSGRKPIGERAMSSAERSKRERARMRARVSALEQALRAVQERLDGFDPLGGMRRAAAMVRECGEIAGRALDEAGSDAEGTPE